MHLVPGTKSSQLRKNRQARENPRTDVSSQRLNHVWTVAGCDWLGSEVIYNVSNYHIEILIYSQPLMMDNHAGRAIRAKFESGRAPGEPGE